MTTRKSNSQNPSVEIAELRLRVAQLEAKLDDTESVSGSFSGDQLIFEEEAARALGVSHGTLKAARLHRLESNPLRDLPHVRIGRSVRYRKSDIAAWIESNTVRDAGIQE